MSHPPRVRGLKQQNTILVTLGVLSHPPRVRGLKLRLAIIAPRNNKSHPPRVRGLKLMYMIKKRDKVSVAPPAGAWIETLFVKKCCQDTLSHPPRVRGLKLVTIDGIRQRQ